MKAKIFSIFLFILAFGFSKAQTTSIPTFTNIDTVKVLSFNLEGYSWLKLKDQILPGNLYFRIEGDQLFTSIPGLDTGKEHGRVIMEVTKNFYLEGSSLTLEFSGISGHSSSAGCVIILNLSIDDRRNFDLFSTEFSEINKKAD